MQQPDKPGQSAQADHTDHTAQEVGPSFGTTVEPALSLWQGMAKPWPVTRNKHATSKPAFGRPADLLAIINANAKLFGSGQLAANDLPLWVTGHQAWLWHPGILAKDIASAAAAKQFGGDVIHLVVDHDIHDALHMQLPKQLPLKYGSELHIHDLTLAVTRADIPSACQPPVAIEEALAKLRQTREQLGDSLKVSLDSLECALSDLLASASSNTTSQSNDDAPQVFATLGHQMAALTARLLAPWTGQLPILLTSQLCELAGFSQIVSDMLGSAEQCAQAYNRAVRTHPQAGIGPLAMDRQFVELPLWLLTWQNRRQPVYADITDSVPILVTADGSPVPQAALAESSPELRQPKRHQPRLAPRAMLLTAIVRRYYASVFIHGTGGGVYDKVTEAWWTSWRSTHTTSHSAHDAGPGSAEPDTLAPMAVATADLRLPFDLPLATQADVRQARQRVHHLKHNLNLEPDLSAQARDLAQQKKQLLAHMHDDADARRKHQSFKEIHAINDQLAKLCPQVLEVANEQLTLAQAGLKNHATAMKRDWPFVIYADAALKHLAKAVGL